MFLGATFHVSSSNNIVACYFARFVVNDFKGRQVANGNGASFPWQQHKMNVKTWLPKFRRA